MTEEHVKEVIFNTLICIQGRPPIDTQIEEWSRAVDDMYDQMKGSLSFSSPVRGSE